MQAEFVFSKFFRLELELELLWIRRLAKLQVHLNSLNIVYTLNLCSLKSVVVLAYCFSIKYSIECALFVLFNQTLITEDQIKSAISINLNHKWLLNLFVVL